MSNKSHRACETTRLIRPFPLSVLHHAKGHEGDDLFSLSIACFEGTLPSYKQLRRLKLLQFELFELISIFNILHFDDVRAM